MEGHYHLNKQVFTRSKGHSATGGAAYRAGEKIYDERTGETFDYRRKKDVYGAEIVTPHNAPDWTHNRGTLWNKVEETEKRKDSQLAYGLTLALPNDIPHQEKTKLVRKYVEQRFVARGMIADIAYHDFEGKFSHNPHAHVMLTTRKLQDGEFSKKVDDWRPKIAKVGGKVIIDPEQLKDERKQWANQINNTYKRLGIDKQVSHLSYKERGIDRMPQIHMGAAHSIEHPKDNRQREPKTTRLGDMNRLIAQINQERELEHQLAQVIEEKERYEQQLKKQKERVANDAPAIESYKQTVGKKSKNTNSKKQKNKESKQTINRDSEENKKQKQQQKMRDITKPRGRDR